LEFYELETQTLFFPLLAEGPLPHALLIESYVSFTAFAVPGSSGL